MVPCSLFFFQSVKDTDDAISYHDLGEHVTTVTRWVATKMENPEPAAAEDGGIKATL